jgi:hypothetical protein
MLPYSVCEWFPCRKPAHYIVERHYLPLRWGGGETVKVRCCDEHKVAEFAPERAQLTPKVVKVLSIEPR